MLIFAKLLGGLPRTFAITGTTLRNGSRDAIFDKTPDCANISTLLFGRVFLRLRRESSSACVDKILEVFSFFDAKDLLLLLPICALDVSER